MRKDTKEYCATCSAPRNPECTGCKDEFKELDGSMPRKDSASVRN
jgi:hypothetical protein